MNIFKKTNKIISSLENPNTPFLYYILTFFSWVSLREFLELFSDTNSCILPFFKLYPSHQPIFIYAWRTIFGCLLHHYLFWIFIFLLIAIILSPLAKVRISTILKVVFSCSLIINITPVFDLIISKGAGFDIGYVYPKTIWEFLPLPKDLTPGMRFTGIVAIVLSFIYCKTKTNSLIKSLLASLGIYISLMITAILPLILNNPNPISVIRFYFIIIFMEFIIIFYLWNRRYCLALLKDARVLRVLHFWLMFFFGISLTGKSLILILWQNSYATLSSLIAVLLAWIAALMFNNLEDFDIDRISNNQRPIVNRSIPKEDYKKIALTVAALSVVFGLEVNFQTAFFMLLLMGNSFIYSLPPFRAKRMPIFSKIFISFNSLLIVMLGYSFAGEKLVNFPSIITWYFLVFITLAINFIDIKDYEGDRLAGISTLPTMLGLRKAKLIIGGFFLIAYCILGWVFLDYHLFILGAFIGGLQFFFLNKKTYQEKMVLLTYLISIAALLAYLHFCPVKPFFG